jgi:uncharacterized membrane protein YcaP (DUF421 family)
MNVLKDLFGIGLENLEWYQASLRAAVLFPVAMVIIRIAGMRSFGNKTPFDVVMGITIGAVLSRCITGHYPILSCLSAAMSLALCHRITGYLSFRFKLIKQLAEGDAILLYKNGKLDEAEMRRHSITNKDIEKALRDKNIRGLDSVSEIFYENDGKLNAITKK